MSFDKSQYRLFLPVLALMLNRIRIVFLLHQEDARHVSSDVVGEEHVECAAAGEFKATDDDLHTV